MKQMKDEGGGRKTIDGMDVLEGTVGLDHDHHVKDGKKGKFNKKTGKVEYEGGDEKPASKDGFASLAKKNTMESFPSPSKKTSVDYPSIYGLDAKTMPGLAKRAVGDDVTLVVRGRIKSASQNEDRHTIDLELRDGKLGE
jgi:hypothetical protein